MFIKTIIYSTCIGAVIKWESHISFSKLSIISSWKYFLHLISREICGVTFWFLEHPPPSPRFRIPWLLDFSSLIWEKHIKKINSTFKLNLLKIEKKFLLGFIKNRLKIGFIKNWFIKNQFYKKIETILLIFIKNRFLLKIDWEIFNSIRHISHKPLLQW